LRLRPIQLFIEGVVADIAKLNKNEEVGKTIYSWRGIFKHSHLPIA